MQGEDFGKHERANFGVQLLVIKCIILPQGDPRGKWISTYEGSFVVKKIFLGGAMILTTIDYFTKWVEAASFASVTKNVVAQFIKHNLIC